MKLVKGLLPRHMQIINEINTRFKTLVEKTCRAMKSVGQTGGGARQTSAYGEPVQVAGGFAVNGVAALHSDLGERSVPGISPAMPNKFGNVNGIPHVAGSNSATRHRRLVG